MKASKLLLQSWQWAADEFSFRANKREIAATGRESEYLDTRDAPLQLLG
jgi:hypothetical protein